LIKINSIKYQAANVKKDHVMLKTQEHITFLYMFKKKTVILFHNITVLLYF